MIELDISPIPNQTISITIENNFYDITLKACNNVMSCDITRNNILIQSGIRIVSGEFLINYPYLENGNFLFITDNDDYPFYKEFGVTQFLLYFSNQEIIDELGVIT